MSADPADRPLDFQFTTRGSGGELLPMLAGARKMSARGHTMRPMGEARSYALIFRQWLTFDKRLFLIVAAVNSIALMLGAPPFVQKVAPTLAAANIFGAVFIRNERIVRALHVAFAGSSWAQRASLPIRLRITSGLLYMGGLHKGFAVCGLAWLVFGLANAIRLGSMSTTSIAIGLLLAALLSIICVLATRQIREKYHDLFEYTHRYLGWICQALLWLFVFEQTCHARDGLLKWAESLFGSPSAWFAAGTTILVAAPWFTVRRVRAETFVPSQSVVAIRFAGGSDAGAFGRISRGLLSDWHTFALVSKRKTARSHKMIISALGDFTRGLLHKKPKHLYVRSVKFYGLPYSLGLYKRAVIVATGAGIAPFISMLLHNDSKKFHVIWVGRAFVETYGAEIAQDVLNHQNLTVWDTKTHGRPDMLDLTVRAYHSFKAEAVFIGCNPEATRQLVAGCSALGIPAFGPSWDS